MLVISIIYIFIGKLFVNASREFKRMESVTRSPIFTHFTEVCNRIHTWSNIIFLYLQFYRLLSEQPLFVLLETVNSSCREWSSYLISTLGLTITFGLSIDGSVCDSTFWARLSTLWLPLSSSSTWITSMLPSLDFAWVSLWTLLIKYVLSNKLCLHFENLYSRIFITDVLGCQTIHIIRT